MFSILLGIFLLLLRCRFDQGALLALGSAALLRLFLRLLELRRLFCAGLCLSSGGRHQSLQGLQHALPLLGRDLTLLRDTDTQTDVRPLLLHRISKVLSSALTSSTTAFFSSFDSSCFSGMIGMSLFVCLGLFCVSFCSSLSCVFILLTSLFSGFSGADVFSSVSRFLFESVN